MARSSNRRIKLAEALALRAATQRDQSILHNRMQEHLIIDEGEKPDDNAADMLNRYVEISIQLRELIVAINETNLATRFDEGTITSAIAERDRLAAVIATLEATSKHSVVYTKTVTREDDHGNKKLVKRVSVFELDSLKAELRRTKKLRSQLDMRLQLANWETELIADDDSPLWNLVADARDHAESGGLRSVFDKSPSRFKTLLSRGYGGIWDTS